MTDGNYTHFCDCRAPKCPECGDALMSHAGRGWKYYHRSNYDLLDKLSCSLGSKALEADGSPANWDKVPMPMTNVRTSLREIQVSLPWTIRYSQDFRSNPQPHKDFAHAIVHVVKATGKLAALVDDMDHDREVADDPKLRDTYGRYVADLVVCAMRAANTFPGGVLDLEKAVLARLQEKNPGTAAVPVDTTKVSEMDQRCGFCGLTKHAHIERMEGPGSSKLDITSPGRSLAHVTRNCGSFLVGPAGESGKAAESA